MVYQIFAVFFLLYWVLVAFSFFGKGDEFKFLKTPFFRKGLGVITFVLILGVTFSLVKVLPPLIKLFMIGIDFFLFYLTWVSFFKSNSKSNSNQ